MDYRAEKIRPMQHAAIILFVIVAVFAVLNDFYVQAEDSSRATLPEDIAEAKYDEPIIPVPLTVSVDARKVQLGDRLYHDKRLSHDNTIACASCHDLKKGGTDQKKYSVGIRNAVGGINSPTTFNSGFNFVQFWDGRAQDLEAQAPGPVHNPMEMGSSWDEAIPKLKNDNEYVQAFKEIYFDEIKPEYIIDAIATFEKTLITPDSRFDQFLRGNKSAMTAEEKEGYAIFKEFGCISCHQGVNMGGNMYQTIGVMEDYFKHRELTDADLGRYNVTKKEWNRYQFKVPTLRNIAVTYPYLHDGSVETLEDVLNVMWNSQLGRPLTEDESGKVVKFLKTLTGKYKGEALL